MAFFSTALAVGVPELAPERPVTWPKRTRAKLANGLEIVLAEAHSIPKFHGELVFRSGNAAAIHRAPGLAEMTASVVRTGTKNRASRQIEEDLRRIGADLSASAGADSSAIAFAGLSEFSEQLLGTVNELAREASFPRSRIRARTPATTRRSKNGTHLAGISRQRTIAQSFIRSASLRNGFRLRRRKSRRTSATICCKPIAISTRQKMPCS